MKKRILSLMAALILTGTLLLPAAYAERNYDFTLTGDQAADVLAVAAAQLGLTGTQMNYSADWCAYFASWCGRTAGADFPPSGSSNTPRAITNWFVNNAKGTFYYFRDANYTSLVEKNPKLKNLDLCVKSSRSSFKPQPGDLIIYRWNSAASNINWSHIGIVESFSGSKVNTIEGNVGGNGYAKNTVSRCTRKFSDNGEVAGILRPNYTGSKAVLTMKFNTNGGYVVSNDYATDANDAVCRINAGYATEVTANWDYDYGHENGLYNAATFGMVRDGYSFVGWCKNRDGSGIMYDQDLFYLSQTICPELASGSKSVTLYAIWAENDYLSTVPEGIYALAPQHAEDMRLDVNGASFEDNANLQLYQDSGSGAQRFRLTPQPDGTYIITNFNSDKVLDVENGSWISNTNVRQMSLSGESAQKWYLSDAGDGYYYIRPCVNPGLCLEVGGAATANNSNVKTFMIHNNSAQKWRLIKYPEAELRAVMFDDWSGVSVTVTKGWTAVSEARLIAAVYDYEGRCLGCTTDEITLPDKAGDTVWARLSCPSGAEDSAFSCRVFLVDPEDCSPLCPAVMGE